MASTCLRNLANPWVFPWFFRFVFFWANIGPRLDNICVRWANIASRWGSVGPRRDPTWANMAPIPGPTLPQNGRRPWGEPGTNLGRTLRSMGFRLFLRHFCFRLIFRRVRPQVPPRVGGRFGARLAQLSGPCWPTLGAVSPLLGQVGPIRALCCPILMLCRPIGNNMLSTLGPMLAPKKRKRKNLGKTQGFATMVTVCWPILEAMLGRLRAMLVRFGREVEPSGVYVGPACGYVGPTCEKKRQKTNKKANANKNVTKNTETPCYGGFAPIWSQVPPRFAPGVPQVPPFPRGEVGGRGGEPL